MDLVSTRKKLVRFRIKELKDVLTQLGLSKQGKKQDLMERILGLLSNEVSNVHGSAKKNFVRKTVGEIIDDVHRKLQGGSSSTNEESSIEVNNMKPKEEVVDSVYLDKKIRCPCGSSLETEYMIQCADPQCQVLQHICCVVIPPEDCSEGIPTIPCQFYCEICRINRADPFWMTMGYLLSPVKLITSNIPADGTTNPLQSVEKSFQLTRKDRCLLQNVEYDVQAWCILLNDKVPFRMQWPLYADLKVNGVPVRTVNRPGSQLLGANGRDEGPMIAIYMAEGINQISLSGSDARSFCLGVRLIKRRTVQQILNLILNDQNGEPFEDALARICRCIGGGMAATNEDSDSDLEVIADCVTVNLRCPMSGSRIRTAGRFRPCAHMGCFDLETFVQLNQRSRKWQCPICLRNYSLEDITIDPYFNRIAKMLSDCEEDATEIDVKPDGSWRTKNGYQFRNLEQWHLPDGSMCVSMTDVVSNSEARQLEEGIPGHINLEQSSKHWNVETSSMNHLGVYLENNSQKVITMSSSSSESHGDDGGCSINQYGVGQFNASTNDGHETNTISYNFNTTAKTQNKNTPASVGDPDVIVLSDSEEENANLTSPETISIAEAVNSFGHSFSAAPGISNAYTENLSLDAVVSSSLSFLNNNGNDFEMSHQEFGSGTREDSPFELLDTDNVLDALIDSVYTPVTSSAPIDGYALASECSTDPSRQVVASSVCHSGIEMNDSLVSNPLAFVCADQTLLPSQPPGLSMQSDLGNNPQTSNGTCRENFNSCGLENNSGGGNSASGVHPNPATTNGLDFVSLSESNEGLNDRAESNGTRNRKISNGPFSFPRQPRSVRRPYP